MEVPQPPAELCDQHMQLVYLKTLKFCIKHHHQQDIWPPEFGDVPTAPASEGQTFISADREGSPTFSEEPGNSSFSACGILLMLSPDRGSIAHAAVSVSVSSDGK